MRVGFLVDASHWPIVHGGLPEGVVEIQWVAHEGGEADQFVALGEIDLVVVEAREDLLTADLVAHCDQVGVVLAALITQPQGDEVADEVGVGHRLRQPEDLLSMMGGGHARSIGPTPHADGTGHTGALHVFWGPHGAPGVTTLALAQASVLARAGLTVCVVDADARGGVVGPALGLIEPIPGLLAAIRLVAKDQLTSDHLERLSLLYSEPPTQFQVLTSTPRPLVRGEINRDHLDGLIEQLRQSVDVIVVDAGNDIPSPQHVEDPPSPAAQLAAHLVWRADQVTVVGGASPTGVARLARVLPAVREHAGPTPIQVWLNGVDTARRALGEVSVLREALWRYAELSDYVTIARDDASAREASRRAITLTDANPQSAVIKVISHEMGGVIERARTAAVRTRNVMAVGAPATKPDGSGALIGWIREKWLQLTALR